VLSLNQQEKEKIFNEMNDAIYEVASRNGIILEKSRLKESANTAEFRANFSWIIDGLNRGQRSYVENAENLDLNKEWIFTQVNFNFNRYEILGVNMKRYKYPVKIYNHSTHKKTFIHPDQLRKIWTEGREIFRSY